MSRPHYSVPKALEAELPRKVGLLIGVSGGIDSIVLLHGCFMLKDMLGLKLEVAHIDHRLRASSRTDAKFVAEIAKAYGLKFHLKRAPRIKSGENIEAWGRKIRYDFFAKVLRERKLSLVLTAHNADDVAETFLMRLISNKELKTIDRVDPVRKCLRPLCSIPRSEIVSYQREHRLQFRDDPTNKSEKFLRNRVRRKLIPFLKREFDPRIAEVLSLRAVGIHEDIRALEELGCRQSLIGTKLRFGSAAWLKGVRLSSELLPAAIRWRVAEAILKNKLGFNLGRSKCDEFMKLLGGKVKNVELPGGIRAGYAGGSIRLFHTSSPR